MTLSTPESKQDRVRRIIKALLAKTTQNGATEQEAMAAAQRAKELMEDYQIEIGPEALLEEGITKGGFTYTNGAYRFFVDQIMPALENYLEVQAVRSPSEKRYFFVGLQSDVLLAEWMVEALVDFVLHGAKIYVQECVNRAGPANIRRPAKFRAELRKSYVYGAAERISARLRDLTKQRNATRLAYRNTTGRDLVLVNKQQLVNEAFRKMFPRIKKGSADRLQLNRNAYESGQARGNDAQFNRPVGSGSQALLGHS